MAIETAALKQCYGADLLLPEPPVAKGSEKRQLSLAESGIDASSSPSAVPHNLSLASVWSSVPRSVVRVGRALIVCILSALIGEEYLLSSVARVRIVMKVLHAPLNPLGFRNKDDADQFGGKADPLPGCVESSPTKLHSL